jgi:PmbA protein
MSPAAARDPRAVVAEAIDRVRAAGADAADALLVVADATEARVRGAEIDFVKQARERTLGIRALVRGTRGARSAVTSTSDLSEDAVARMAVETVELARATAEDPAAGLPEDEPEGHPPDLRLLDAADRAVGIQERIEQARIAEAAARAADPRIVNSEGTQVASDFAEHFYANTRGFVGSYASAHHSLVSEPVARQNGSLQRDHWLAVGRRLADLEDPAAVGRRAAERAVRRLGARRVATCEVPVIFDPVTAPSLLAQLAACVNGYAVYRETSFLAGRLGETIASGLLTVIDDGRRPGGLGSRPFDGEGLPTRRNVVLDRGRLASWLLDSYSARRLGLRSTGNAARSAGSAPTAAPSNLWVEPGRASLADLIATTARGLLVTELIGMGFNPVTGDYSRGAAGLWIESGEITGPVEEITIAGNLGDMLRDVDAVGSDLLWLGRIASPSLRVARMTVAGE